MFSVDGRDELAHRLDRVIGAIFILLEGIAAIEISGAR
jgi:hypothetical protein